MTTVFNVLQDSGQRPESEVMVEIRCIADDADVSGGFDTGEKEEASGVLRIWTDAAGRWEANLKPNSQLQPANSYYKVTEVVSGQTHVHTIVVGAGAGPLWLYDLLITPPAALATIHETDTTDAHDASAISFVPGGTLASNNVQAAIEELLAETQAISGHTLAAHDSLGLATQAELDAHAVAGAHTAANTSFAPAGGVAAVTVQAAIAELDAEKATMSGFTQGSILFVGAVGNALVQDNPNLFWDDTNNWLGIGTAAPEASLHIRRTFAAHAYLAKFQTNNDFSARIQLQNSEGSVYLAADQNNLYIGRTDPTPVNDLLILNGATGAVAHQYDVLAGTTVAFDSGVRLQVQGAANEKTAIFRANATSPGDIQAWQDSAGVDRLVVRSSGADSGSLVRTGAAAGDPIIYGLVTGDTIARFVVDSGGVMVWGPGGGTARDTNLYRSAANVLKTDDSFEAGASIKAIGSSTGDVSAEQVTWRVGLHADSSGAFLQYGTPADSTSLGQSGGFNSALTFSGTNRPVRFERSNDGLVSLFIGKTGQTFDLTQWHDPAGAVGLSVNSAQDLVFASGKNIVANTVTGTKIGTATNQKIAFWNASPVTQRAFIAAPLGGLTIDLEARAAINSIRQVLIDLGLKAAA